MNGVRGPVPGPRRIISALIELSAAGVRTGPDVLSTVGVGSGYGAKAATHYIGELWLGNKTAVPAVVSGLAAAMPAAMPAVPAVRTVVRPGSVPFLSARIAFIERARPPGVPGGLVLQVINPECQAVDAAFFTGFAFLPQNTMTEVAHQVREHQRHPDSDPFSLNACGRDGATARPAAPRAVHDQRPDGAVHARSGGAGGAGAALIRL